MYDRKIIFQTGRFDEYQASDKERHFRMNDTYHPAVALRTYHIHSSSETFSGA